MSLDGLIAELNDLYATGEGVYGTYLSGSAAYGGMTEYSDVDFYVLTRDHHGTTERIMGIQKVEIRWRTEDEILVDIARGGPFIYQMMDAKISIDPNGKIAELKIEAQERFETFQPSKELLRDLQFRLGEARNKLIGAIKYQSIEKQGYLASVYSGLLMEAIFTLTSKPVAPPAVAWRWLRKLPGLNESGVEQFEKLFGKPTEEKIRLMERHFEEFHGAVTARLRI
ncbi:MAG TPA: hypothetical protein DCE78_06395 [Bacteroidetes bacterium]|nr:hypothetical protein [Bacteroidota bacterium]